MATRYVSNNPAGSNTSPYDTLAKAATVWATAITGSSVGDIFAFSNLHNEADAVATTLTMVGTTASPNQGYSYDNTQTTLSATDLLSGAKVTTTANNALNINGSGYLNGITFISGASTGVASLTLFSGASSGWQRYENCSLQIGSTGAGNLAIANTTGSAVVELYNTTVSFSGTGQVIKTFGSSTGLKWQNTASALIGAAVPTILIGGGSTGAIFIEGVDLSAAGSTKTLVGALGPGALAANFHIKDCKINAAVTIAATPLAPGPRVYFTRSDSTGSVNRFDVYDYTATETQETSVTRVGTLGDFAGNLWSKKIVTTSNAQVVLPYDCEVSAPVNLVVSPTVRTVTVFGTINAGSVPNNNDIWIEVVYPQDSGDTLGGFVNSGAANPLTSGSAVSSDGSSWNGGGSGAGWSPFKLTVTLTAQLKGPLTVRVKAAKASTTYYIDPVPVLS